MSAVLGVMVALLITFRAAIPGMGPREDPEDLLLPQPFPAPELVLVDPSGSPVRLSGLQGSVVALFFGYTNCPDVCPITLTRLGTLQEEYLAAGRPLEVIFVSVDPERDTPEQLRRFSQRLPGEIRALTAPEEEVRRQAGAYGVLVREQTDPALPEGEYLVDHTARTFLVGPAGEVVATLPPMPSPDQIDRTVEAVFRSLR